MDSLRASLTSALVTRGISAADRRHLIRNFNIPATSPKLRATRCSNALLGATERATADQHVCDCRIHRDGERIARTIGAYDQRRDLAHRMTRRANVVVGV